MPGKFKRGAIVRLKSGGPQMTIQGYRQAFDGGDTDMAFCSWFDENRKLQEGTFHEDSLMEEEDK